MKKAFTVFLALVFVCVISAAIAEENAVYTHGSLSVPLPEGEWNRTDNGNMTTFFSGEKANLGDGYITFVVTDLGSSFSVSSPGIVYSLIENTIKLSATDGSTVVEYTQISGNSARVYTYYRTNRNIKYPVAAFCILLDNKVIMGISCGYNFSEYKVKSDILYMCDHAAIADESGDMTEKWECPECGHHAEGNFCSNCGTRRYGSESPTTTPVSTKKRKNNTPTPIPTRAQEGSTSTPAPVQETQAEQDSDGESSDGERYEEVIDHYETQTVVRTRRVLDHYETYYTYEDRGHGSFEEVAHQRPVYVDETYTEEIQVPVYKRVKVE